MLRNRSESAATTSTAEDEIPETSNTSQHRNSAGTSSRTTASIITKEDIDICDILYHRMCEVECEMYELNLRCEAWRRLNNGYVYPSAADYVKEESTLCKFEPFHYSSVVQSYLYIFTFVVKLVPKGTIICYCYIRHDSGLVRYGLKLDGTTTIEQKWDKYLSPVARNKTHYYIK